MNKFVRSGFLDVLAWTLVAFLFAIWLMQSVRDFETDDTGHAAYIGLRGTER